MIKSKVKIVLISLYIKKLLNQLIHHTRSLVPANDFFSPVIQDGFRGQLLLVAPVVSKNSTTVIAASMETSSIWEGVRAVSGF